ncbi:glycosyltransferase [Macrococcus brunensis]|uniref:Glycosyltransferase n=1 Tax=Macrococcus brunensis TaxID=198483 RepID=A0A4R6BAR2_9STAP|nr:glycosyltransferase family 4 protein [Macrococcus brunensis]TDL93395.1 glycosyltransferase [Macrococcus brunensis]
MKIGFVTTWMERGGAYVTKAYIDLLKDNHEVFVYARGGVLLAKGDQNWDKDYVTWAPRQYSTNIRFSHFKKWIEENEIDTVFFNEQQEIEPVLLLKKQFPQLKVGTYIDYYKENTVKDFDIYDFLICNTKRHYSVFKDHAQCFYVPWGTDIETFKLQQQQFDEIVFFHSSGLSNRKGTTYLVDAFMDETIYPYAKLIIHTQQDFEKTFSYSLDELQKYNIQVIEKTVSAPGLYHLGNVYVYPTKLDGLGLTMYEALACGLPVIATDNAPMNEVINNKVGRLVEVENFICRADAYYWPLSIVKQTSLIEQLRYFIDHKNELQQMSDTARQEAVNKWNWLDRKEEIERIFTETKVIVKDVPNSYFSNIRTDRRVINAVGSSRLYSLYDKIVTKMK